MAGMLSAQVTEFTVAPLSGGGASGGSVRMWGGLADPVPPELTGVTAVAAGGSHVTALRSDGTVISWGNNDFNQLSVPAGLAGVTGVAASDYHSLAVKADGTVAAWGEESFSSFTVPAGLTGVVAVAAGSSHSMALKSNGTVVVWGSNLFGQLNIPAGLSGVTAIAAGPYHCLAIKADGTVAAWGWGEGTEVPTGLTGVVKVAGAYQHSVALKADGTVVAWGANSFGECTVPAGLSGVVAVSAGYGQSLALKSDGSVVAWGDDSYAQATVPADVGGVSAIACGGYYNLAVVDAVGFGEALPGTPGQTQVFTIRNLSSSALTIISASLTGAQSGDFSLNTTSMQTVLAANTGETTVSVTFQPTAGGARNARLRVAGTAAGGGEQVIELSLVGTGAVVDIAVFTGAGTAVENARGSGVGLVIFPSGRTQIFTLSNPSQLPLTGLAATLSGPGAAQFTLSGPAVASLAPGETTTVSVDFPAGPTSLQQASLSIASNDPDENPFLISLEGQPPMPEISVFTGDTTAPAAARSSGTGLASLDAGQSRTFTLLNAGDATLTGLAATLSGLEAARFSVSGPALTSLVPGASTTVTVSYSSTTAGYHQASLSISSNDADENPFVIPLVGTPLPEISVFTGNTTVPAAARSSGVGTALVTTSQTFTIRNEGNATLFSLGVSLAGTDAAHFTLSGPAISSLSPGNQVAFTVTYAPSTTGHHTASVQIYSNDEDENPFLIALEGQPPPPVPEISVFDGSTTAPAAGRISGTGTVTLVISKTFTILNDGDATLTGLAATLTGAGAAEFSTSGPALISLAPGASTSVSVTYSPGTAGPHTANLQIASNDDDENPFLIALEGQPPAAIPIVEQPAGSTVSGSAALLAWGANASGQSTIPAGLGRVKALALGNHTVALLEDGTLQAWGNNSEGQTIIPAGLSGVTAIAAGRWHTLALKNDGTVAAWGRNTNNQLAVPVGLSNVTAIAAGEGHSVALKNDGTVVAWGWNDFGQTTIPAGLGGVTAIAAGYAHTVALKSDGTVVCWGLNNAGQNNVPAGLTGVVAIAAGEGHTMALKPNGLMTAWGWNSHGQVNVPAGLTDVAEMSAGYQHSAAVKRDGSLVVWGRNDEGQLNLPAALRKVAVLGKGPGANHLAVLSLSGITFAPQLPGTSSPALPMTVRNGGSLAFTITSVALAGENAGDFSLDTSSMTGSVPGESSTSFALTFTPSAPGYRRALLRLVTSAGTSEYFLVGIGATPEITILDPLGSSLGTGTDRGFIGGPVTPQPLTFTLRNDGNAPLTGLGFSLVGADAAAFHVTPPATTSLAAGASTNFTLAYAPALAGSHTAALQISSNDLDEASFVIMLSGAPSGSSLLTFEGVSNLTSYGDRLVGTPGVMLDFIALIPQFGAMRVDTLPTLGASAVAFRRWEIRFSADPGTQVRLNSFYVTQDPLFSGATNAFIGAVQVLDGETLEVLQEWLSPLISSSSNFFDTSSLPARSSIILRFDPGSLNSGAGVSDISFSQVPKPPSAAQSWRYQNLGTALNTGVAADDFDADGDGLANLLEFAFGTHPGGGGTGPLDFNGTLNRTGKPVLSNEAGGPYAVFIRRSDHAAAGLTYKVEFSPDLSQWQPGTATPEVLANDGTHQVVRVAFPALVGGQTPRFFRVKVAGMP